MTPTRNVPQVLVGLAGRLAGAAPEQGGALWRLAEPGRQLDANLIRLPPGGEVRAHVEEDLDVLLVVVEGSGRLGFEALEPHGVAWLPRGSRRALTAGPQGLAYLTVHQRRPALSIRGLHDAREAGSEGGEGPCRLDRVCAGCGRLSPEPSAHYCGQCGEPLPTRSAD